MTDLRTKAGREEEILDEIKKSGGLNTFWATENQMRAGAVDRLINSGKIKRISFSDPFPFARYKIMEEL